MIRILFIAILVAILYRLVVGKPILGPGPQQNQDNYRHQDGDYVDYEEIDEGDKR